MRYFDELNKNSLHVSNITASPAFHDMLMPVSDLQQRTISLIWFWLQYLMLALITFLFIRLGNNNFQKISILNISVLFTYTEAWKANIIAGQIYFFIAFLFTLIIYFLIKSSNKKNYVLPAAFSTALLILCKPVALILFLPFAVRFKFFFSYITISISFVLLYVLLAFFNKNEGRYWVDYYYSLGEQVKVHQHQIIPLTDYKPLPQLTRLEGYNLEEIRKMEPVDIKSENGNAFVLIQFFLNNISVKYLVGLFLITVISLMVWFIKKYINIDVNLQETILLAFLFYLLLEFFSPIYRHQYYTVQFLPLIFTSILSLKKCTKPVNILILIGLVLNISNTSLIPMRHTLGEFCWMLAMLFIIFKKEYLNNTI